MRLKIAKNELAEDELALAAHGPEDKRSWYLSREGHTFALLAVEPADANDAYRLAVSAYEVTKQQFLRFLPNFDPLLKGVDPEDRMSRFTPHEDCPVLGVNWFEAAAYCNWLSWKERIPPDQWCYVFKRGGMELGPDFMAMEYDESNERQDFWEGFWDRFFKSPDAAVELAKDWRRKSGYRLPTEPEWELTCLTGATTFQHYGSTQTLLPEYAVYAANSPSLDGDGYEYSHIVGTKLPNRFGLFDMHGNVYEWCQPINTDLTVYDVKQKGDTISRGGAYASSRYRMLTKKVNSDRADEREWKNGLRVVRTYPY